MTRYLCLATLSLILTGNACALIIVDGAGGDDGASPFTTLQAAVDYARTNGETEIEIDTNGPIAGADLSKSITNPDLLNVLPQPLTIRAGAGYSPVINSTLRMLPKNTEQLVTLENLSVLIPNGASTALEAGCNLDATNCVFSVKGVSNYHPAVTAAVQAPDTTATLNMTSCTLTAHNGIQAGRAIQQYNLTHCLIIGDSNIPHYAHAIANNNNFPYNYGGTRLDQTYPSLHAITVGRAMNLDSCIIQCPTHTLSGGGVDGGQVIGWPAATLGPANVTNEDNCLGPIVATNCVFTGGGGIKYGLATPGTDAIGTNAPQDGYGLTLINCTFHMEGVDPAQNDEFGGAVRLVEPNGTTSTITHKIYNCLFDMPTANYVVGTIGFSSFSHLTGDGNIYHCPMTNEYFDIDEGSNPPPFESTYSYLGNGDPDFFTDLNGNLQVNGIAVAAAKAVAMSPPLTIDKDDNPRPMPASATKNDVGADEVDETAPAAIGSWSIY